MVVMVLYTEYRRPIV